MAAKKNIILGVCGSIAAFKAADICSLLVQRGARVSVIMTKEAESFIAPMTLAMLSCNKVFSGMFDVPEVWDVEHISLADSADLVLIAPATANVIGKLAAGICDDFLTCTVTATKAPVLIAPAMNDGMYTNKIVKANIERLEKTGYNFIGPVKGRLACGRSAIGRLSDVEEIVASALKLVR